MRTESFSPQAWGCTVYSRSHIASSEVFPTGVGVYRILFAPILGLIGFPHRRGGVPGFQYVLFVHILFSPQAWGCTEMRSFGFPRRRVFPTGVGVYRTFLVGRLSHGDVFPTGVGVYRLLTIRENIKASFPHRRGGVPRSAQPLVKRPPFSPQAWGCTDEGCETMRYHHVFPTGVGVYRA